MNTDWVFDNPRAAEFSEVRRRFVDLALPRLRRQFEIRTALDIGCGIGYFSGYLADQGFAVEGIDGRAENVAEARRRYPTARFSVADFEADSPPAAEPYDLVLCFGLLYHLENPVRAVRRLHTLTRKILLLETMVVPGEEPMCRLQWEPAAADQALKSVALVPSESFTITTLYGAGFANVFKPKAKLRGFEFQGDWRHRRRRTLLIASTQPLTDPLFVRVPEPPRRVRDYWLETWAKPLAAVERTVALTAGSLRRPRSEVIMEVLAAMRRRVSS